MHAPVALLACGDGSRFRGAESFASGAAVRAVPFLRRGLQEGVNEMLFFIFLAAHYFFPSQPLVCVLRPITTATTNTPGLPNAIHFVCSGTKEMINCLFYSCSTYISSLSCRLWIR